MTDREPLLAALGVDLDDELLTLALTHRSFAYENGGLPTNALYPVNPSCGPRPGAATWMSPAPAFASIPA